ncbi:hypothetical protein ACOSQ3_033135 [Xanthoceras sorbifolium]
MRIDEAEDYKGEDGTEFDETVLTWTDEIVGSSLLHRFDSSRVEGGSGMKPDLARLFIYLFFGFDEF